MKDAKTNQLRQIIVANVPCARETNSAQLSLIDLSFQSTIYPERHIWIGVDEEEQTVSCDEYWGVDKGEIPETRATLVFSSFEDVTKIVREWLSGTSVAKLLETYDLLNGGVPSDHR